MGVRTWTDTGVGDGGQGVGATAGRVRCAPRVVSGSGRVAAAGTGVHFRVLGERRERLNGSRRHVVRSQKSVEQRLAWWSWLRRWAKKSDEVEWLEPDESPSRRKDGRLSGNLEQSWLVCLLQYGAVKLSARGSFVREKCLFPGKFLTRQSSLPPVSSPQAQVMVIRPRLSPCSAALSVGDLGYGRKGVLRAEKGTPPRV